MSLDDFELISDEGDGKPMHAKVAIQFAVDRRDGRTFIEDVEVTNVYEVTLYDHRVAGGDWGWPVDILANRIDRVAHWVTFWNGVLHDESEFAKVLAACQQQLRDAA